MRLDYGLIGVDLLIFGVALIVLELAFVLRWSLRIARRARALNARLANERGRLEDDLTRLRRAMAETEALWQPYARLLRWIRHPLAIALMQSLMRRMAGTP